MRGRYRIVFLHIYRETTTYDAGAVVLPLCYVGAAGAADVTGTDVATAVATADLTVLTALLGALRKIHNSPILRR